MTHELIDQRSLAMARQIAEIIDRDPAQAGLERARETCQRWQGQGNVPAVDEWVEILRGDWPSIRAILLDPSEDGTRLRQSSPFCGVLSGAERLKIYKAFMPCNAVNSNI